MLGGRPTFVVLQQKHIPTILSKHWKSITKLNMAMMTMTAVATAAKGRRRKGLLTTASERAESHVHDFNFSGNILWKIEKEKEGEKQLLKKTKAKGYGSQNVLEKATAYKNRDTGRHTECMSNSYVTVCICSYVCDTVANVSLFLVISHSSIRQWQQRTQHMTFSTLQHRTQQKRHCMLQHL